MFKLFVSMYVGIKLRRVFLFCVYWCRPSPKSYQNLDFQVYDMYFFLGGRPILV